VHAATIQTVHDMPARLASLTQSVLCMSVDFVSCTPSASAAWSLLVDCIICSKQHCHCCWPCSCTMLLGSILTAYSIVLCICRFCGLYSLFHIPMYSLRLAPQWFSFTGSYCFVQSGETLEKVPRDGSGYYWTTGNSRKNIEIEVWFNLFDNLDREWKGLPFTAVKLYDLSVCEVHTWYYFLSWHRSAEI